MKKKIVCSSCGEIIEIETDEEVVYCPKCSKPLNIVQGEKYFNQLIFRYYNTGVVQLYSETNYLKAIDSFNEVLKLNKDDMNAIQDLAIAKILISTIRVSHIKESLDVLKEHKSSLSINKYNIDTVVEFLKRINRFLNKYKLALENNLISGNYFYEQKGKDLYIAALKDIYEYKLFLKEVYYKSRRYPADSGVTIGDINKQIEILSTQLNQDYHVMGHPSKKLDSEDIEMRIEDRVFSDNRKFYKRKRVITILVIVSLLILIAGIITLFAMKNRAIIGVSISGLGLISFIVFTFVNKNYKKKLVI